MSIRTFELLGRRLKVLRRRKGITQARLSEAAGVSYKYYQEIEGGRRDDLKLSTIIRLAVALELELNSIFDFDSHPRSDAAREVDADQSKGSRKS